MAKPDSGSLYQMLRAQSDGEAAKKSKAAVHYGDSTNGARCCGTCSMLIDTGHAACACTAVRGDIHKGDVCDLWAKRSVKGGS